MVEWANRLWQALLPLGGVFVVIGIQIHASYGFLLGALIFWVLALVCWVGGILGLVWSFRAIKGKEGEDSRLV